jgi:hypothetical protein
MKSMTKSILLAAFLASATAALWAQSDVAPAPMPPLIATAKTAFLSYEGSSCAPEYFSFSGTLDRGFNEFSAAARSKLHYTFVDSPASAELVLAFRSNCDFYPGKGQVILPRFYLTAYDAKYHVALWTFSEEPKFVVGLKKTRDTQFDIAITNLVDDVLRASPASAVAGTAGK